MTTYNVELVDGSVPMIWIGQAMRELRQCKFEDPKAQFNVTTFRLISQGHVQTRQAAVYEQLNCDRLYLYEHLVKKEKQIEPRYVVRNGAAQQTIFNRMPVFTTRRHPDDENGFQVLDEEGFCWVEFAAFFAEFPSGVRFLTRGISNLKLVIETDKDQAKKNFDSKTSNSDNPMIRLIAAPPPPALPIPSGPTMTLLYTDDQHRLLRTEVIPKPHAYFPDVLRESDFRRFAIDGDGRLVYEFEPNVWELVHADGTIGQPASQDAGPRYGTSFRLGVGGRA